MSKNRSIWARSWDTIYKLQNPQLVSDFQQTFGVHRIETVKNGGSKSMQNGVSFHNDEVKTKKFRIESKLWYYIFNFGTSLGYELFYASFFPFWVWNLDAAVCRRVVNVWVLIMYVGQALKDIIKWPRPSSPPVVHMEPKYVPEYGMPSTHAMVGVALPFSLWYFTSQRYEYPFLVGLFISLTWCALVCCSRLYMGMHTVLDIIAGLLLSPLLMCTILPFCHAIDHFQQFHSPLVTIFIMVFLQVIYPRTGRWSPARGDTSVILGTGTGFAIGHWLNNYLGFYEPWSTPYPLPLSWPSFYLIGLWMLRFVIGVPFIIFERQIVKTVSCFLLCKATNLDPKDLNSRRKSYVELPTKYLTYIGVGLVITFLGPLIFRFLHIEHYKYAEL